MFKCRTIVFVAYEECDMASNLSKETHVSVGVCFYMLQQQMTLKIAVVQISIFLFHSFCDHWRPSCCLSNHHLRISSQQRKRFRQRVKLSVKDCLGSAIYYTCWQFISSMVAAIYSTYNLILKHVLNSEQMNKFTDLKG